MKIAVDCRLLTNSGSGVSNFLLNAINNLNIYSNMEFYLIAHKKLRSDIHDRIKMSSKIHILIEENIYSKLPSLIYLYLKLPIVVNKLNVDFYWSPTSSLPPYGLKKSIRTIVTVHDLVDIEYKPTMSWKNRIGSFLLYKRSIKKADNLWAVSQYTKCKIIQYFPDRNSEEIFVGSSIDRELFRPILYSPSTILDFKRKYNIEKDFILFVGSLEPRKNLKFLINLMINIYKMTEIQLVIVGAKGWKNSEIYDYVNNPAFPKRSTLFLGFVSADDLVTLYNLAKCFVSTSLNEGFGLPQLEALCCNCNVVTAHNSAMIEVVNNIGTTVKGWNKEDWTKAVVDAIENPLRKKCKIPDRYDWKNIAIGFNEYLLRNNRR